MGKKHTAAMLLAAMTMMPKTMPSETFSLGNCRRCNEPRKYKYPVGYCSLECKEQEQSDARQ